MANGPGIIVSCLTVAVKYPVDCGGDDVLAVDVPSYGL
jgi:hypothetical protein